MAAYTRRPEWLRLKSLNLATLNSMGCLLRDLNLRTVCESAHCPNRAECFSQGTATFMILGNTCTRNCTFCAVRKGKPLPLDPQESEHIVEATAKRMDQFMVFHFSDT